MVPNRPRAHMAPGPNGSEAQRDAELKWAQGPKWGRILSVYLPVPNVPSLFHLVEFSSLVSPRNCRFWKCAKRDTINDQAQKNQSFQFVLLVFRRTAFANFGLWGVRSARVRCFWFLINCYFACGVPLLLLLVYCCPHCPFCFLF